MGVVVNQSIKNTISTYIGFGLGALNTLYFYTHFMSVTNYGVVSIILSVATLLMPFISFGIPNTVIKYFPTFQASSQRQLLGFSISITTLFAIVSALFLHGNYPEIVQFIMDDAATELPNLWYVYWVGVSMAFFELGYAISKVYFKTVFGNFTKEIPHRLFILISLLGLNASWYNFSTFLGLLVLIYALRALLIFGYVLMYCQAKFSFKMGFAWKPLLSYSLFILLGTTAALVVLELDKVMINQFLTIEDVAYYTVAVFIATVVAVPMRSMHQITLPITSKLIAEDNSDQLVQLYKSSSIHLLVGAGFILLLLLVNIQEIYSFIPSVYQSGMWVVAVLGLSKLIDASLGINNAILYNSKYFKTVLLTGILLAIATVGFNLWLIPKLGIMGAAWASLLAMAFYNGFKIAIVYQLYGVLPYSAKTLLLLVLLTGMYFIDSWIPTINSPFLSILIKSLVYGATYTLILYKTNISKEFNELVKRGLRLER